MISPRYREAVFELAKGLSAVEGVQSLVLFGSVARGEADARSDIDILLVLKRKRVVPEANKVLHELERRYQCTIQSVVTDQHFSGLDRNFVENVFKEGILLYGQQLTVSVKQLQLEPYVLIQYETKNCAQQLRTRLVRILYGYSTHKRYRGKKYISTSIGLLQKYGGRKVGLASILVPLGSSKVFINILASNKITYKKLEVWIAKV